MSQLCYEHTRTLMLGYVFDSAKGLRIIDLKATQSGRERLNGARLLDLRGTCEQSRVQRERDSLC